MIEDISYLKENSENDSIAFYIDSGERNKKYWPTPSEYSVSFQQPFKYVYGFDILDASIPTTQYNVTVKNNRIALTLLSVPEGVALSSAEYHIKNLSWSKEYRELFESLDKTRSLLILPNIVDLYNIRALSNSLTKTTTEFYVYVQYEIDNVPIVLKTNQLAEEFFFFEFGDKKYAIGITFNNIIDIISYANYSLVWDPINGSKIFYYERLKLDEITYDLIYNRGEYLMRVENVREEMVIGNYDITTIRNELNNLFAEKDIEIETTTPIETKQSKYKLTSSSKIIILNGLLSTVKDNIGFSELPTNEDRDFYQMLEVGDNPHVYMAIYDPFFEVYKLEAPGLVNLFGERYVILRIKEIEDHLLGSYSYIENSPGMGIFKLASSFNDVTNLRFDYISLVKKPFHPIGKLSKITLRFETAKGELYDFKGVNHQMLMVIKFMVPTQKFTFSRSLLNPNYDPNFMKYMANNKEIRNKENSDNEEDYYDDDLYNQYQKEMIKYNKVDIGSSSGEETDSESDTRSLDYVMRQRRLLNA